MLVEAKGKQIVLSMDGGKICYWPNPYRWTL